MTKSKKTEPEAKPIRVRAKILGTYGGCRRRPGHPSGKFTIKCEEDFRPVWMEKWDDKKEAAEAAAQEAKEFGDDEDDIAMSDVARGRKALIPKA